MIRLCEPEQIHLSNDAFRYWMKGAGLKIKELDEKNRDILSNYGYFPGAIGLCDDIIREHYEAKLEARESELFDVKMEIIGLKFELQAVISLWRQLRHEMD